MRTIKHFVTSKSRPMIALRWTVLIVILATPAILLTLPAFAQTKYVITDGDNVIVCLSSSSDPQEVIAEAGLKLRESDTYTAFNENGIAEIHINRVQMISVKDHDEIYVVGSYGETVREILEELDITLSESDTLSCTLDAETYDGMSIEITRIVLETQEFDEPIPFETVVYEDSTLPTGEEVVLREGVDGTTRYTAQITYENGTEIKRTILSQSVIAAPQERVVLRGMDRYTMEQGFTHVDDYLITDDNYSYKPPMKSETTEEGEQKFVPGTNLAYTEAALAEYISKLEAAGVNDYAAAAQEQIDAWVAANK